MFNSFQTIAKRILSEADAGQTQYSARAGRYKFTPGPNGMSDSSGETQARSNTNRLTPRPITATPAKPITSTQSSVSARRQRRGQSPVGSNVSSGPTTRPSVVNHPRLQARAKASAAVRAMRSRKPVLGTAADSAAEANPFNSDLRVQTGNMASSPKPPASPKPSASSTPIAKPQMKSATTKRLSPEVGGRDASRQSLAPSNRVSSPPTRTSPSAKKVIRNNPSVRRAASRARVRFDPVPGSTGVRSRFTGYSG